MKLFYLRRAFTLWLTQAVDAVFLLDLITLSEDDLFEAAGSLGCSLDVILSLRSLSELEQIKALLLKDSALNCLRYILVSCSALFNGP